MNDLNISGIKKVVVWGYAENTHTHSYIHAAFYKTFKYLGYETYWFNNSTNVENFDFSNTLFMTSGVEECERIPIRKDCLYILHNCCGKKFFEVKNNMVVIQVLTNDVFKIQNKEKINEYTYTHSGTLYQPWATNLLPEEINLDWAEIHRKKIVNYVGTVTESGYNNIAGYITNFARGCSEDGITVHAYGGYTGTGKIGNVYTNAGFVTEDKHISLIQESAYAPQFCGIPQVEMGYIPCRIFKNISYGHLGVTNSKYVNQIFDNTLICDEDGYELYHKAKSATSPERIREHMKIVKEKHTYINRIKEILRLFR